MMQMDWIDSDPAALGAGEEQAVATRSLSAVASGHAQPVSGHAQPLVHTTH